jgi:energy-coupling factor transporter ATP-binding protein EcfA2
MHLQRVQVPDFRVLKDVDITFEKNFNPRVFPLGSQNGGGKSTLLQLIFVLLHCSSNTDRHFAIKNLLGDFILDEGLDRREVTKIDILDDEKNIHLDFFVCRSNYLSQMIEIPKHEKNEINFNLPQYLSSVKDHIEKLNILKEEIETIDLIRIQDQDLSDYIQRLYERLSLHNIKLPKNVKIDFANRNLAAAEIDKIKIAIDSKLQNLEIQSRIINSNIFKLTQYLKSENIFLITQIINTKSSKKDDNYITLLCHVSNLESYRIDRFFNDLSNKIFLAAPSTQIFLFVDKQSRKSLFQDKNIYQLDLIKSNADLNGLFTYDFLATDILVGCFQDARDRDFKEAIKTGEYGSSYKSLLQDLDFLLHNKQVNLMDDFSGITFKLDRFKDIVELYPEDLSHGELKRLNIYVWLKYKNIKDAIVLMDEVDLALHPDWQYQIVSDLLEWEPSNQYILATHSYELCNALTPSHVKILEPKLTERRID